MDTSSFCPSDEGLVLHLLSKTNGFPVAENSPVNEYDLYGDTEPWEIWDMFNKKKEEEIYFITKLKQISLRLRRVGSGTWTQEDAGKMITVRGYLVAVKRYHYENTKMKDEDGKWVLHEYRLQQNDAGFGSEYVICRMKRNGTRKRKFRNLEKKGNVIKPGKNRRNQKFSRNPEQEKILTAENPEEGNGTSEMGITSEEEVPRREISDGSRIEVFDEQLRNGQALEEEEVEMLPNPFFSDGWIRGWKIFSN